jgi:hypothetical protein
MILIVATAALATVLAQSAPGESFNPTRRQRGAAPPPGTEIAIPVEPSLYQPALPQRPNLDRHATERALALLVAAQQQQQQTGALVCHVRVMPTDPNVDPGIAIRVPADRDYKIVRIVPPCSPKP